MAGVWMDLWVAAALAIVAWLVRALSGRPGLRSLLGRAWTAYGSGAWALRKKFGLIAVAWVALPALGWTVTVMTVGPEALGQALSGRRAATLCHERIDRLHRERDRELPKHWDKDQRAESIAFGFPQEDGYGGTLDIDDEGFIACSHHGRSPNQLRPLAPRSTPEELGVEASTEICHRRQQRVSERVRAAAWDSVMVRHDPERIPEYIAQHFPQSDHYGGTLTVDDEGYVTCSEHGRAERSHPVLIEAGKK